MERRASAGEAVVGTSKPTPRCLVRVVAGLTKPPATAVATARTNALRMTEAHARFLFWLEEERADASREA
tara:strand:+ start:423 stop:632 length:210 start_codon:yes stop_codon:yes gene_type:complete